MLLPLAAMALDTSDNEDAVSDEFSNLATASADSLRRNRGGSVGLSSLGDNSLSLGLVPTLPVSYGPTVAVIRDIEELCCGCIGVGNTRKH